ncbi:hypothetical protein PVK06_048446 [Gossypium arboreum]|uniref:Uncharacterized protein n=1 Tax=Gossypium arboreum TaxID=29729 RepID=A0ABR0MGG9_GOSAR|nr:hypothetical protein PVK06_048446 [Gossypium arboreum]
MHCLFPLQVYIKRNGSRCHIYTLFDLSENNYYFLFPSMHAISLFLNAFIHWNCHEQNQDCSSKLGLQQVPWKWNLSILGSMVNYPHCSVSVSLSFSLDLTHRGKSGPVDMYDECLDPGRGHKLEYPSKGKLAEYEVVDKDKGREK